MDELKQKIANWFVNTFAAKAVTKALSAAAVLAMAHGWMKQQDSTTWISSNTEVIVGALGWGLSWLLTRTQHTAAKQATVTAVETALVSPTPVDVPATAKAIIENPVQAKTPNGL